MSLTGIFLILFLVVHLSGNFKLFYNDGGEAFNHYTDFMSHNPLIQTVAKGLYLLIIVHTIQGILIAIQNRKAKGQRYKIQRTQKAPWASRSMALLGVLIFAFLMLHMGDFWLKLKMQKAEMVTYTGLDHSIENAYALVQMSFSKLWIVICYLIGCLALGFHLWHGFQSAFQTLGINHKKYTPIINFVGKLYSVLVPLGFASMPLYFLLFKS